MKKFILILFILLFIPNVKAEVTDTTGPTLNSYSFATTELYNNKTVNINIDAVDDISGASYVDFDFVDLSKDYEHDINGVFAIQVNIRNGNNTYVSNRINRSTPGNYTLRSVRVYDNNNNSTCYISSNFNGTIPGCDNKVKGLNVVLKDIENTTFSELKSFSVSKNNISPNEDVTFNMTFNDNKVKYIVIAYDGTNHIQIENTNNATSISKTVNVFDTPGKEYKINTIILINTDDNTTEYIRDPGVDAQGHKVIRDFNFAKQDIVVSGEVDDVLPELKSFSIESPKVYAPGILKVRVNAVDNIPNNIKQIQVDVSKKGSTDTIAAFSNCTGDDSGYLCSFDIDQYTATGTYYIRSIIIHDKSNNMNIYWANGHPDYIEMEYKEFEIDTDVKSDLISSTENEEATEKIEKTKDDATITLDSTKNSIVKKSIFDSIKNTNKKLYIESKGIQWIFEGSKIVNETKDIDVSINIYQNEKKDDETVLNSINSLVVEFKPNGKLPGIAKVRIKADYVFRNFIGTHDLYVFYYDETDEMFDLIAQKIDMTDDGYYEFYIDHNSKYVISNTIPERKLIKASNTVLKVNNTTNKVKEEEKIENKIEVVEEEIEDINKEEEQVKENVPNVVEVKESNKKNNSIIFRGTLMIIFMVVGFLLVKDSYKKKISNE